jgi:hypothetical protein
MKETIEEFMKRGGKVKQVETAVNLDFDAYLRKEAYKTQLNRSGGSYVKRARSVLFRRGAGVI